MIYCVYKVSEESVERLVLARQPVTIFQTARLLGVESREVAPVLMSLLRQGRIGRWVNRHTDTYLYGSRMWAALAR